MCNKDWIRNFLNQYGYLHGKTWPRNDPYKHQLHLKLIQLTIYSDEDMYEKISYMLRRTNFIMMREIYVWQYLYYKSGLILGMRPANERRRYFVMTSLIGWEQT